jgi:hypothetical protein
MSEKAVPCVSAQGHSIQPSVTGRGYFVCIRCWQRFACPVCVAGSERWFAVYCCHQHSFRRAKKAD